MEEYVTLRFRNNRKRGGRKNDMAEESADGSGTVSMGLHTSGCAGSGGNHASGEFHHEIYSVSRTAEIPEGASAGGKRGTPGVPCDHFPSGEHHPGRGAGLRRVDDSRNPCTDGHADPESQQCIHCAGLFSCPEPGSGPARPLLPETAGCRGTTDQGVSSAD